MCVCVCSVMCVFVSNVCDVCVSVYMSVWCTVCVSLCNVCVYVCVV